MIHWFSDEAGGRGRMFWLEKAIPSLMLMTIFLAIPRSGPAVEHELQLKPDSLKPHGEYYEATVPHTLDLAERARLAVHGLTSFLNPQKDYEPYGHAWFNVDPPYMTTLIAGGNTGAPNWGKIADGIVMNRLMCGSDENLDVEAKSIAGMVDYVQETGCPVQRSRIIMALMSLYTIDPRPEVRGQLERIEQRLHRLPYYANQPPAGELGYFNQAASAGTSMRLLSRWYVQSGNRPSLEVAGRIKDFIMQPKFWEAEAEPKAVVGSEHGHFMGHHHSYCSTLMGLLWYADVTNDAWLKQFVHDGYEYFRNFGIARIGLFGEMCTTADMIFLAIKLGDAGVGDYWEDVDCYVRNQLAEMQITDGEKLRRVSQAEPVLARLDPNPNGYQGQQLPRKQITYREPPLEPREETDDRVCERNVGVFLSECSCPSYVPKLRLRWTVCCPGNCTAALYQAWESIVRYKDGAAVVNLLLNRASPWLDLDSYLPYEGKVVIRNKMARKLSVRIPRWVDKRAVKVMVKDKEVPFIWTGNYVILDSLAPGDEVKIAFPMVESVEEYTLKWQRTGFWQESTNPGNNWKGDNPPDQYTMRFRGNTLVEVGPKPSPNEYVLYQRDELKGDRAPMKKVTRFVTSTVIKW